MKTLLLMRHAKSSWKHPDLPDAERPLAKRGLRACKQMAEVIVVKELQPQLTLTSLAVRAAETARLVCEVCGCQNSILAAEELYLSEADTYINRLQTLSDDLERVLVVGHNPGLESLLQMLSGQIETFPTAAVAHISLPIVSWKELNTETEGTLVDLWKPKEVPEDFVDREEEKKEHQRKKAEKEAEKETAKTSKKKTEAKAETPAQAEAAPAAEKKPAGKPGDKKQK